MKFKRVFFTISSCFILSTNLITNTINDFQELWQSIEDNNKPKAQQILNSGVNINLRVTRLGITLLHKAANEGRLDRVALLVELGADVNKTNLIAVPSIHKRQIGKIYRGQTPLHIAALKHKYQIVDFLLKHGAHVQATTTIGKTPLDYAIKNTNNENRLMTIAILKRFMSEY